MTSRSLGWLFAMSALLGCSSFSEEGLVIEVTIRGEGSEDPTEPPLNSLSQALLTVSQAELLACQPQLALINAGRAFNLFRPSAARAHSEETPTRLGTPHVVDLLDDQQSQTLGRFLPVPRSYCTLRLIMAPADADAVNLDQHPQLLATTLLVAAEPAPERSGTPSFRFTSSKRIAVDLPLPFGDAFKRPSTYSLDVRVQTNDWRAAIDATPELEAVERVVPHSMRCEVQEAR